MQQPQADQQMQQPVQYTTPQYQPVQQPIMLCPVQYLYEPLLPDEPAQPSPAQPFQNQAYVINVQNTPPWAQNRPNVVYMQQMPRNIQPYIPQHMAQNPMYNYQYQPMIVQEQIRPIVPGFMNQGMMQNPQMIQNVMNQQMIQRVVQNSQMMQNGQSPQMQNAVQNQFMQSVSQNQVVTQNPTMMNANMIQNPLRFQMEKRETPILASMLNARKVNQSELVSLIRPQFQTVRPQMIIVNPITKHTCAHNTQKEPPSLLIEKQLKNDIQLIKSQVPEGLSVKTIKAPVTASVKSNDNIFQNIALCDNIYPKVNPKPKQTYTRDSQTNYKRKIKELLEMNNKDGNEVLGKRSCFINKPDEHILNAHAPNASESQMTVTGPIQALTLSVKKQVEDKKIRNTVYVQARGRINEPGVNDVLNIDYANNNNTNTENSALNNTNNGNLNFNDIAMTGNANLKFEYLNNIAVNVINVGQNNIMNVNNQSMEINNLKDHINDIPNFEGVLIQSENNDTNENTDDAIVQDEDKSVKDTSAVDKKPLEEKVTAENYKENKVNLKNIVLVKENIRQDEVTLPQIIASKEGGITLENSSITLKKLLAIDPEPKARKTRNAKVSDANIAKNITTTSQTAKISDSNDLQTTLISKSSKKTVNDDLAKSMTEMSNMTKIIIASDNQNNLDVNQNESNVNIITEDTSTKTLKNNSKFGKATDADKLIQKKKVSNKEKQKKEKKKIVKTNAFEKEPMAIYVLTHVLDGHIIQESNVPFEVQKPSLSPAKDKARERDAPASYDTSEVQTNEKTEENTVESLTVETEVTSNTETDIVTEDKNQEKYDNPDTNMNETLKCDGEGETKGVDEDHPFKLLNKETFEKWTVSDIYTHLMKYEGWRDTALKLDEQEIDGESLLLVRKAQLISIGICEEQAEEINEFTELQ